MSGLESAARTLLFLGIVLLLVGGLLLLLAKMQVFGNWHVPGDMVIRRERFTFFFPVVSMLLLSLLLTVVLNVVLRIFRG